MFLISSLHQMGKLYLTISMQNFSLREKLSIWMTMSQSMTHDSGLSVSYLRFHDKYPESINFWTSKTYCMQIVMKRYLILWSNWGNHSPQLLSRLTHCYANNTPFTCSWVIKTLLLDADSFRSKTFLITMSNRTFMYD